MMISIITAIYNQMPMNRLYLESIRRSTRSEWELIIIDNGSTDGSLEFFEHSGENVRVIRNDANYSYPHCQNQGIDAARGDVLAFFNNDIMLSDNWDTRLLEILGKDGYEAVTLSSNDNMLDLSEAKKINRRFKRVKYPLISIFKAKEWTLKLMMKLTYGDFQRFCDNLWDRDGLSLKPGFAGSAVVMTRKGIDLIGRWDETQQGADFDLYMRSLQRFKESGDVRPLSVVGGIYHHHFSRLTSKCSYPQYADIANIRTIEDKWGERVVKEYTALQ